MEKHDYASSYLIKEGNEAAFVDTNTNIAVPLLIQALENEGLKPENVKYIILTHAHLDHAGGAGKLSTLCPQAKVLAHPVCRSIKPI